MGNSRSIFSPTCVGPTRSSPFSPRLLPLFLGRLAPSPLHFFPGRGLPPPPRAPARGLPPPLARCTSCHPPVADGRQIHAGSTAVRPARAGLRRRSGAAAPQAGGEAVRRRRICGGVAPPGGAAGGWRRGGTGCRRWEAGPAAGSGRRGGSGGRRHGRAGARPRRRRWAGGRRSARPQHRPRQIQFFFLQKFFNKFFLIPFLIFG